MRPQDAEALFRGLDLKGIGSRGWKDRDRRSELAFVYAYVHFWDPPRDLILHVAKSKIFRECRFERSVPLDSCNT